MPTKTPDPINISATGVPAWRLLWHRYRHLNLTFLDQAVVSGSNFLAMIILARTLGPTGFGCFALGWMMLFLLNSTLQAGLVLFPMLSIGPKQADQPTYYGTVCLLQLLFTSLCFIGIWMGALGVSAAFPHWPLHSLELPLAIAIGGSQLQDFLRRLFFAKSHTTDALQCDLISYGGQLIALLGFAMFASLAPALALMIIGLTSLLAVLACARRIFPLSWSWAEFLKITRQHWQFGSWLALSNLLHSSGSQGILMMAGLVLGPLQLGGMQAIINLCGPVNIAMQGLQNRIPVQASIKLTTLGHAAMVGYLARITFCLLAITGCVALIVISFRDFLVQMLYGPSYLPYNKWVVWMGLYVMMTALILPLTIYFRTIEKTRVLAIAFVAGATVSLAVAGVLMNSLHALAVFIGLIANQIIMLTVMSVAFLQSSKAHALDSPRKLS